MTSAANLSLVTGRLETAASTSGLAAGDFSYVASLVGQEAAIEIGPDKHYLVEQRLSALARQQTLDSISQLLSRARADASGRTAALIVDAMTTNETSFFRDPTLFEFLRAELLPELIERNRTTRTLRIWCGATSSGQEPYSLTMLLREHFPEVFDTWRVRILASDISPTMVARTRAGRYGRIEVNRGLPANLLVKHFTRDGLEWEIDERMRRMVETREINLARPFNLAERFDLVLLRNVLIYFSVETKRAVLGRVRQCLAPGGALFLGSSESTMQIDDTWVRRAYGNISCYQPDGPVPPVPQRIGTDSKDAR
jgi:chemotaxis protein methyltransferase CheR